MSHFLTFSVIGIVTGCIFAVAASGLVVTYTTSGIFNFAHGAIGMFMAFTYWELRVHHHWAAPFALMMVLFVCAPVMGLVIERLLIRNLHGKETRVSLVVTIALLLTILFTAYTIWPGTRTRRIDEFFAGRHIRIFDVAVSYHQLTVIAVAITTAIVLRLLLFHTRLGVTMRAVVDDPELSSLNGAHPERIAQFAWALGSTLAAAAGILIAPQVQLNHLFLTLLVVNGYAAAILGKLKSLPLTFVGAIVLGLLDAFAIGYGSGYVSWLKFLGSMKAILPTVFLFAILVFLPQVRLRAGRIVGVAAPRVPGLRQSMAGSVALVAVAAVLSRVASEYWVATLSEVLVFATVMLSLVLLTGYAGQVSLMQMVFVGAGAVAMGRFGDGSVLGLILAAVMAGAFGALVAIPALRLQDLYVALTTLAFAVFGDWAFNQRWALDLGGLLHVKRLHVPGFTFRSEESQLILAALVFALAAVFVLAIRRGPYGRLLAAMRDSPTACTTLGLNLVGSKTAVFAVSGAIAGVAGALFGGLHVTISAGSFPYLASIVIFAIASFAGLTTITGALFGGIFFVLLPELTKHLPSALQNIQFIGISVGAIALADDPNGFAGNFSKLGEILRARFGATGGELSTQPFRLGAESVPGDGVPEPAVEAVLR